MTVLTEKPEVTSAAPSISVRGSNNISAFTTTYSRPRDSANIMHQSAYASNTSVNTSSTSPPLCRGLSALIQAATSQLAHLVDTSDYTGAEGGGGGTAGKTAAASDSSQVSHQSYCHADGYASSSDGDLMSSSSPPPLSSSRNPTTPEKRGDLSFPEVLMKLLEQPDYCDIITFLPDGKFFAIRQQDFSETLMVPYFQIKSFDEFLDLMQSWGFTRISGDGQIDENTIQVFRHAYFRRGNANTSPSGDEDSISSNNNIHSQHPHYHRQAGVDSTQSDDPAFSAIKRRLSPSHITRDAEDVNPKQRAFEDATGTPTGASSNDHERTPPSAGSTSYDSPSEIHHPPPATRSVARRRSSTEARSIALAVTAARLNIHGSSSNDDGEISSRNQFPHAVPGVGGSNARRSSTMSVSSSSAIMPLEEGGVQRVTQSIVTDAIESLLFDESHTRETFLKHEKELSTSAFPGVEPISKYLFSSPPPTTTTSEAGVREVPQSPPPPSVYPQEEQSNKKLVATMPQQQRQLFNESDGTKENRMTPTTSNSATDAITHSPTQLEAATALMKQSGRFGALFPPLHNGGNE